MQTKKEIIPIFFATDDNYFPYLAVALKSLIQNANKKYTYNIYVLNNGIKEEYKQILLDYANEIFNIKFEDVNERLSLVSNALDTRDYYSKTTYYRFFIQKMFPEYDKALYLDADIIVKGDISEFYNIDIGENFIGAIEEQIVASVKEYREYSKTVLGLDYKKYFNAGILIMNLKKFREYDIEKVFTSMIATYRFDTIAQDQDYLNFILKDKVYYVDKCWNKESISDGYKGEPKLIHYALFKKPWTYYGMKYDKDFWFYAKQTVFYDMLIKKRENHTEEDKINDKKGSVELKKRAKRICKLEHTFINKVKGNVL